jgi:D-amino-acid dehydrogenase
MSIVVIGGGIVGLASAWHLRAAGHRELLLLDRAPGPAEGTSFANGALLHPSSVEPWNSPGILGALLRQFGRDDAAVRLRARALPSLIGWGLRFLRESTPARFAANARANTALAVHSMTCLHQMSVGRSTFDHAALGSLMVLRDVAALNAARAWAETLESLGVRHRVLDRAALVSLEPALGPVADHLVGAIHNLDDETGDCHRFCHGLAHDLQASGVELRWGSEVARIEADREGIRGLRLRDGSRIVTRALVLAAGPQSTALAASLGLQLPVRPAKGYSLTYDLHDAVTGAPLPRLPVIDRALHVALTPLGDGGARRLRVAGTAEFCGDDLTVAPSRVANLSGLAERLYPQVLRQVAAPRVWTGLRPLCADGRPLIGPTRVPGLWLNTGHGHLGWTVGAASGQLLAQRMAGKVPPGLDAALFDPSRFAL